mgnify:CR=1 FL=1
MADRFDVLDLAAWKESPRSDCLLRKSWTCDEVLTKADEPRLGEREVGIIISTSKPDRDKDIEYFCCLAS